MLLYIVDEIGSCFPHFLGIILEEHGVCPLVVGVHGVFCADRLSVSSSVFLAYAYIG